MKDTLEAGSAAKIVDCILGLKSCYQWKQSSGGCGPWKHAKSPFVMQTASRIQSNSSFGSSVRRLDLSANSEKEHSVKNDDHKSEGYQMSPEL